MVAAADAATLAAANINPTTGLATDYLNHLNEIVMLLEMVSAMPECVEDIIAWRPKSYVEHFADSGFAQKELAIDAYRAAAPGVREELDARIAEFDALIAALQKDLAGGITPQMAEQIGILVFTDLRPLIDRMSGIIHGADSGDGPASLMPQPSAQDAVDELFS